MKKQMKNPFDELVENLSLNFSKVEGLHKMQESEEGKKHFDLFVKPVSDMENYEALFLNY